MESSVVGVEEGRLLRRRLLFGKRACVRLSHLEVTVAVRQHEPSPCRERAVPLGSAGIWTRIMTEKTKRIEPRLPRGFEDRLPGEIAAVDQMIARIKAVYERYG